MKCRSLNVLAGVSLGVCLTAILASWAISFWIPHGFTLGSHRKYGLRCDRGTIQLRIQTLSDLRFDAAGNSSIVEVGFDAPNP
jgi:hypothetical protein